MKNAVTTAFLKHLAVNSVPAVCFLTNGIKLNGVITYIDADAFTLTRDGVTQLIFRHAVATVMPQDPFCIHEVMEGK